MMTKIKKIILLFQMPTGISSSRSVTEKAFRRLLTSTEKLLVDKTIEDWKLNQVK
jgi:hypothetical protein